MFGMMKKNIFFILMFVLLSNSSTTAQGDCWEVRDQVESGTYRRVLFFDSLYGLTILNTFGTRNPAFKVTTDAGNTWQLVFQDKDSLFIDSSDGTTKYKWIYQSPHIQDLSCSSQNLCFAVGNNTITDSGMVWKSTDFGTSWEKIKTGFNNGFYEIIAVTHDLIYALAKRVIRSTDGGETWVELNIPIPDLDYGNSEMSAFSDGTIMLKNDVRIDINDLLKNDNRIYRSTDFGETWTIIDVQDRFRAMKMVDKYLGYAAICPIDSNAYIIKTTDGGFNWTKVYQSDVLIKDGTPSIRFIATYGKNTVGVFGNYPFCIISTDAGSTWPQIGTGLDYLKKCTYSFLPLDAVFHPDGHIYALAFGLVKSKFEIISSINEANTSEQIFPNPALDYIEITIHKGSNHGITKIQFYNTLGIEVLSAIVQPMDGNHQINIERFPKGVYFIKIGNRVEKFLKM